MPALSDRRRGRILFWIGLIAIAALYCCYFLYFIYGFAPEISLKARHVIKFIFIAIAYCIGWLGLRRGTAGWTLLIWHWVYLSVGIALLLLGVYDWAIARAPLSIRELAGDLQNFLVSPVLYVAIGLIDSRQRKGL